jgi:hypothetical protein
VQYASNYYVNKVKSNLVLAVGLHNNCIIENSMSNPKTVITSHARNINQALNDTYLVVLTLFT